MPQDFPNPQKKSLMIWDLPTRLFHWLLVLLVIGAFVTAKTGFIDQHQIIGFLLAGLLSFRILWGIFGSETSRFSYFIKGPKKIADFLRGKDDSLGHNPLGALMVIAFLLLLPTQILLGLFSNDDILFEGPLALWVSNETSDMLTAWHHRLSKLLTAMIAIHIIAIAWHKWVRKENLTMSMFTGWKYVMQIPSSLPLFVPLWRIVPASVAAILLILFLFSL